MNKDEARTLLPWFASGALDADEARTVEAHLQASPDLQRELAELQAMQQAVREIDNEPVFRPALINDALRQIDAYEATRRAPAAPGLLTQAVEWLRETLAGGWARAPAGARVAMVAQFALILVLGGILLVPGGPDTAGEPAFTTAAARPAVANSESGTAITIVFEPTVMEQQIRDLLRETGGEIIAGPSPSDSYTIRFATDSQTDVTRLLGELRGRRAAIRFANTAE